VHTTKKLDDIKKALITRKIPSVQHPHARCTPKKRR